MAITRSAELAVMTIDSPLQAIEAPTFLKSYRWAISFVAWFSALSTSCRSTLLTTSNDDSLAMTPPVLVCGRCGLARAGPVLRTLRCVAILPSATVAVPPVGYDGRRCAAGYPSG